MKIYAVIAFVSYIIRQFVLPNPFEPLGDSVKIMLSSGAFTITPEMLNLFAGLFLPAFTFVIVGIYYHGGFPAAGSILYLIFYSVHIGMLYIMSRFAFSWWIIAAVLIAYVGVQVGLHILKNKLMYLNR